MLDKQIQIYSLDTGHFYSNNEKRLHWLNHKLRSEKKYLKERINQIKKELEKTYSIKDTDVLNAEEIDSEAYKLISQIAQYEEIIQHKNKLIKKSKSDILELLSHKIQSNIDTNGKDHIRTLREEDVSDNNIISVFDSFLTRTIGVEPNHFTDAFMVVQVYYFDVIKDLIYYGFTYKGEKYIYFTSSAGQIRTKKTVFIKEKVWLQYQQTLMCGLTLDKINERGGNNPNKHLAYMALTNSATDIWEEFDIRKSIVIDDFENEVFGEYDFIDETDYSVTRTQGYVPIPHTDGAGMVLPHAFSKEQINKMVRLPWIKGLMGVFDFRKFLRLHKDCSPIITDIYGDKHNIIDEDIQVIFTKSQFKMWKYFTNWKDYQDNFIQYHCTAGFTNPEEERIPNATLNYQMLQTLTDITEEELDLICQKSKDKIDNICNSFETIKAILGITPYNLYKTPLQEAVEVYPPLVNDKYIKSFIKEIKDSRVKKFKYGKLDIQGKYTFILPDFYAACEYWFLGIENPNGLLKDNEVFCWLYKNVEELDCLRSPHLYREHAVRHNAAYDQYQKIQYIMNTEYGYTKPKDIVRCVNNFTENGLRSWFTTNALYTSCHDLISKMLQFDVDGDKCLVVADETFVKVAKRNMTGIVPLYYNMKKAEPTTLNNKSLYDGLNSAFIHSGIGLYSNNISKIWNHQVFLNGTSEEKDEALKVIKLLCCENNFVIDAAKTLYLPERPEWFKTLVAKYTNDNVPFFFQYAKDKEEYQVAPINMSVVNRLYNRVKNSRLNFRKMNPDLFDFRYMMSDKKLIIDNIKEHPVVLEYQKIVKEDFYREFYYKIVDKTRQIIDHHQIIYKPKMRLDYIIEGIKRQIIERMSQLGFDIDTVIDVLVLYLYGTIDTANKGLLWYCFGDRIVDNLKNNLSDYYKKKKVIQCLECGEWFYAAKNNVCYCESCRKKKRQIYWQNHRKEKYNKTD